MRNKNHLFEVVFYSVLIIFTFTMIYVVLHNRSECIDNGGTYVRTLFGMECVKR